MAERSPVSLDELMWLRRQLPEIVDDRKTRLRFEDWLDRQISQRTAQKTKSRTDWHRNDTAEYHAARQADVERIEAEAGGREQHPTEYAEAYARRPPMNLTRWLTGSRPNIHRY